MKSYINQNTICAISTPAGTGAIAIIRMSGEKSKDIIEKIFIPYNKQPLKHSYCSVGTISDTNNEIIDEVVVTYFKSPKSYTGEDLIEIACHGSNYIQQKILELLIRVGAYQALPGEFTYRAFKNGKLDLSQAEAVSDLIISENKQAHDIAVSQLKRNWIL
jgi:tRNA modification GTPase